MSVKLVPSEKECSAASQLLNLNPETKGDQDKRGKAMKEVDQSDNYLDSRIIITRKFKIQENSEEEEEDDEESEEDDAPNEGAHGEEKPDINEEDEESNRKSNRLRKPSAEASQSGSTRMNTKMQRFLKQIVAANDLVLRSAKIAADEWNHVAKTFNSEFGTQKSAESLCRSWRNIREKVVNASDKVEAKETKKKSWLKNKYYKTDKVGDIVVQESLEGRLDYEIAQKVKDGQVQSEKKKKLTESTKRQNTAAKAYLSAKYSGEVDDNEVEECLESAEEAHEEDVFTLREETTDKIHRYEKRAKEKGSGSKGKQTPRPSKMNILSPFSSTKKRRHPFSPTHASPNFKKQFEEHQKNRQEIELEKIRSEERLAEKKMLLEAEMQEKRLEKKMLLEAEMQEKRLIHEKEMEQNRLALAELIAKSFASALQKGRE